MRIETRIHTFQGAGELLGSRGIRRSTPGCHERGKAIEKQRHRPVLRLHLFDMNGAGWGSRRA
jgi:hypothetical protein